MPALRGLVMASTFAQAWSALEVMRRHPFGTAINEMEDESGRRNILFRRPLCYGEGELEAEGYTNAPTGRTANG